MRKLCVSIPIHLDPNPVKWIEVRRQVVHLYVFFHIGDSRKDRLLAENGWSGKGVEEALVHSEERGDLVLQVAGE